MGAVLRDQLSAWFASDEILAGCTLAYRRFKTPLKATTSRKSSLLVCYELDVVNSRTSDRRSLFLYAQAYLDGRSGSAYEALDPLRRDHLSRVAGVAHLPALDMIVWKFPHDPGLPHLWEVIEADRIRRHLPYECLPASMQRPGALLEVTPSVVRYRPESRCTSRYDLRWTADGVPHTVTLYGKTFKGEKGKDAYQRMQYFWRLSLADPARIAVAEPLGYAEAVSTTWQRAVSGTPLHEVIGVENSARYLDAVARGLATLHQSRLVCPRTVTDDHLVAMISKKSGKLSQAFPPLAGRLDELIHTIERDAVGLPRPGQTFIHGDFDLAQLMASDDGRVLFFDFDDCAYGDPLQDVASFLVDLHFHGFDRAFVHDLAHAFTQSYERNVNWDVPAHRVSWHARIGFLERAYRVYAHGAPGMDRQVRHILDLAAAATTGRR